MMRTNLKLLAKIALAFSLVVVPASLFLVNFWGAQLATQVLALDKANADQKQAQSEYTAVASRLAEGSTARPLSEQLAELQKPEGGLTGLPGVAIAVKPEALTGVKQTPVMNSDLSFVDVEMSGTYSDYHQFVDLLAAQQKKSKAITKLKIQGQSFEMTLRMYGT